MEKRAVIDEVYKRTGITLDEAMYFKTAEIEDSDEIADNCDRCSQELEDLYCRGSSLYDLIVLKCPKCKAIYAYLLDCTGNNYDWICDNTEPMNDHSAPLNKTSITVRGVKKSILSKKCAIAYSKGVKSQEENTREINQLI